MNAELLLAHFKRISDAPDAVPRLRRFILDLAVCARLVDREGEMGDQPINTAIPIELSDRRGTKEVEPEQQWPHGVPFSWRWHRLAALTDQITDGEHATPPRISEQQVPLVTAKNVRDGVMDYGVTDWVSLETAAKAWKRCRPSVGDVLLVCVGATTGRLCVLHEARDMVLVRSVALIRPTIAIEVDYLALALRSPMAQKQIWEKVKVAAQPCLYINRIASLAIPLPPLAEQRCIVAKVDELMALCDRLEAAQREREIRRDRLAAASHHHLNNGADAEATRSHAQFFIGHLQRITARSDQIKQLRQTILNLSVRGQLTPQISGDGSSFELLKQILAKGRGARVGRTSRTGQPHVPLALEEIPFKYPPTWEWLRLREIGITQTGTTPPSGNSEYFGDFIPFVKPAALNGNSIDYSGDGISKIGVKHSRLILRNSVLMVCIGATLGKANITDRDVCCNQQINAVTPHIEHMARFTLLAVKSAYFQDLAWAKAGTGTLPILSKGKWEELPVPLPPLAEQHRIVTKVDELMALCDQLEASLATAQTEASRLLESVLHGALNGAVQSQTDQLLA